MKATLFALFVGLLMVGCGESPNPSGGVDMTDTAPKKDEHPWTEDGPSAEMIDYEKHMKIINEAETLNSAQKLPRLASSAAGLEGRASRAGKIFEHHNHNDGVANGEKTRAEHVLEPLSKEIIVYQIEEELGITGEKTARYNYTGWIKDVPDGWGSSYPRKLFHVVQGCQHGEYVERYASAGTKSIGYFNNGLKHGKWIHMTEMTPEGPPQSTTEHYDMGKLVED